MNVLNQLKQVPEVCSAYGATANPAEVIVDETELGRGVVGVIDGFVPAGVETVADVRDHKELLRVIGCRQ